MIVCKPIVGGPLMADDFTNPFSSHSYLAGVVSFGPKTCGTRGFPGVYTVSIFLVNIAN